MKTYNSFEINSSTTYKDVSKVSFKPLYEIEVIKKHSKGEKLFWKWLGIIPLIPYTVKKDLYTNINSNDLLTLEEMTQIGFYLFTRDDKLFRKAEVCVEYISNRNTDYWHFESNEKAIEFIDNLKKRCNEVGNELK